MPTFVLRLIASRPDFAQTMTGAEREIMSRHAAHWRPYIERGDMVVFGPILTDGGSYGLAVVETDDDQALRDFAAQDPVATTGTAVFEFGRMAQGTSASSSGDHGCGLVRSWGISSVPAATVFTPAWSGARTRYPWPAAGHGPRRSRSRAR